MRAALIVVEPPGFKNGLRLCKRGELVHVQTLILSLAVKAFDKRILNRLAGLDELQRPRVRAEIIATRMVIGFQV